MKNFLKKVFTLDNLITCILLIILCFFTFIFYVDKNYRPFFIFILFSSVGFSIFFYILKKFRYKNLKKILKYILLGSFVAVYSVIICHVSDIIRQINDENTVIAVTKDINKAEDIQKVDKNIEIIKYDYDGSFWLKLRYNYSYKDYLIIDIADKYSNDNSVKIIDNVTWSRNKQTLKHRYEKRLTELVSKIYGVEKANVQANTVIQKDANVVVNADIKSVDVYVDVYAGCDSKKIKQIINKLLSDIPNKNVNINFVVDNSYNVYRRYENRLDNLFKNNDFQNIESLLKEAKSQLMEEDYKKLENYYVREIERDKVSQKQKELDQKIAMYPNNYELYIEKGDSTHGLNAIIYYEKAIQVNPKIKDVLFKKIEYNILTEIPIYTKDEDLWFIVSEKYYNHAMEKSEYKDIWNLEIGDVYYNQVKDYKKALEYYNKIVDINYIYDYKIKSPYETEEKNKYHLLYERPTVFYVYKENSINPFWINFMAAPMPVKNILLLQLYKNRHNSHMKHAVWNSNDFLYRVYDSQVQTGLYKDAISTCEEAVARAEKNNENPAYIYDSIINLDLKMKNFKDVKRNSKYGSSIWNQLR